MCRRPGCRPIFCRGGTRTRSSSPSSANHRRCPSWRACFRSRCRSRFRCAPGLRATSISPSRRGPRAGRWPYPSLRRRSSGRSWATKAPARAAACVRNSPACPGSRALRLPSRRFRSRSIHGRCAMTEASAPASRRDPARPCRRVRFRSRKPASLRMSGRASGPTGIAAHGPTGPIPGRVRSARLRRCAMRVAPRIRGSMPARSCCGSRALKAHGSRSSASVQVAAMSVAIYASGPSRRLPSSSGLPMQCRSRRSAVRAGKRTCLGRAWSLVWSGATRPLSSRADAAHAGGPSPGARLPRAAATDAAASHAAATGPSRAGSLRRRASGRRQCRALPARVALRYRRGSLIHPPIRKAPEPLSSGALLSRNPRKSYLSSRAIRLDVSQRLPPIFWTSA